MIKNGVAVGLENAVEIVGCHAEGEVGDFIIGGVIGCDFRMPGALVRGPG